MSRTVFPDGFLEWMKETVPGKDVHQISELVMETYGFVMTPSQVKQYKSNHHLRSDTFFKGKRTKWTEEIERYLCENTEGKTSDVMADEMNKKFGTNFTSGQIRSARKRFGVACGVSTRFTAETSEKYKQYRFQKGQHYNFGTEYAKGNIPWNYCTVGTERLKGDAVYVKLADGIGMKGWKRKHQIVWEQMYGKIPEGGKIIHLDGDPWNCDIENLRMADAGIVNKMRFRGIESNDAELKEANYLLSKIELEGKRKRENTDSVH